MFVISFVARSVAVFVSAFLIIIVIAIMIIIITTTVIIIIIQVIITVLVTIIRVFGPLILDYTYSFVHSCFAIRGLPTATMYSY